MTEKSILEQALLQIENLEEAVKQNAKGILGSVVKQELNSLLKESMKEEQAETVKKKAAPFVEAGDEPGVEDEEATEEETDEQVSDDEMDSEDDEMDSEDDEMSGDDFSDTGVDDMSGGMDTSDEDMSSEEDDNVMDMTGASDEEVVKVFRAMKPEDGIVVKRDGNNLDIEIDGNEYVIKLDDDHVGDMDEEMEEEMSEEEMEDDMTEQMEESGMEDDETVYEIELDETDMEDKPETKVAKGSKKVEATEAARTKWNPHGDKGKAKRAGLKSKNLFKAGSGTLNEEVSKLRKQNDEYKKALVLFKEKLNEVAVFNANLAYATRLFTENSTTKQEKLNILKRFDSISTMNESKKLYSTIKAELSAKKPVTESVVDKISSTPKSSSSKEVLAEAKAYENPQFKRMKELMGKIK
jgi:hypothetical protein